MNTQSFPIRFFFEGRLAEALAHSVFGWQLVFSRHERETQRIEVIPALLTQDSAHEILACNSTWAPTFETSLAHETCPALDQLAEKEHRASASRFTMHPLVLVRKFADSKFDCVEVIEEFRHYHDLAEDRDRGVLVDFDASGIENIVASLDGSRVMIHKKYLMRFLAGTQYHLILFLDLIDFGENPEDLRLGLGEIHDVSLHCKSRDRVLKTGHDEGGGFRLSRKILYCPPAVENAEILPYRGEEIPFIIGHDLLGDDVEETSECWEDDLAKPLTPIYFRKEVLDKYRNNHDRYRVFDRHVSCGNRWGCPFVLHEDRDLVSVYFTDLRDNIPLAEKLHWRAYNVAIHEVNATAHSGSVIYSALDRMALSYTRILSVKQDKFGGSFFNELHETDRTAPYKIAISPRTREKAKDLIGTLYNLLVEGINISHLTKVVEEHSTRGKRADANGDESQEKSGSAPSGFSKSKHSKIVKEYLYILKFANPDIVGDYIRDLSDFRNAIFHRTETVRNNISERVGFNPKKDPKRALLILATKGREVLLALEMHFYPRGDAPFDFDK